MELSGTATTSACHFSCTVPVYLAGSVEALHTWPFLNKLVKQERILVVFPAHPEEANRSRAGVLSECCHFFF